jgi:hypothetical protein
MYYVICYAYKQPFRIVLFSFRSHGHIQHSDLNNFRLVVTTDTPRRTMTPGTEYLLLMRRGVLFDSIQVVPILR